MRKKFPLLIFVVVSVLTTAYSCTSTQGSLTVSQAQDQHVQHIEVTVTAPVKEILPDDTEGSPHQRFLISLPNGTTVLIAHNTQLAQPVPIQVGDVVTIHGQYIWNNKGGVIHWTHHSDSPKHEGGWIEFKGQKYQ